MAEGVWARPSIAFAAREELTRRDFMEVFEVDGGVMAALLNSAEEGSEPSDALSSAWAQRALSNAVNASEAAAPGVTLRALDEALRERGSATRCTALWAMITREQLDVAWCGGERACVLRRGELFWETIQRDEAARWDWLGGASADAAAEVRVAALRLESGDRVALLSVGFAPIALADLEGALTLELAQDAALTLMTEAQQRGGWPWFGVMIWDIP